MKEELKQEEEKQERLGNVTAPKKIEDRVGAMFKSYKGSDFKKVYFAHHQKGLEQEIKDRWEVALAEGTYSHLKNKVWIGPPIRDEIQEAKNLEKAEAEKKKKELADKELA